MSMELSEAELSEIVRLLSIERLSALKKLTGSVREAVQLHHETLRLGASLMTVTAIVEIALRNSICDCLARHFGKSDWLTAPSLSFEWRDQEKGSIKKALGSAQRSEYSKLSQRDKHALDNLAFPNGKPVKLSHNERAKKRQAQITVSDGKIVAELTLFFWKRMFSDDYEATLWKTALKRVFPDKKLRRSDIAPFLEQIYQTRNRLAHHEPVYGRRLTETLNAISFIISNLRSKSASPDTPLARFIRKDIEKVISQSTALNERLEFFRSRK